MIRDARTGGRLAYFSGVAGPSPDLTRALAGRGRVFFDGTFWSQRRADRGRPRDTARRGHGALAGRRRRAAAWRCLRQLPRGAQIFTHINNTNPILRDDAPERARGDAAGVEVAYDGMELDAVTR